MAVPQVQARQAPRVVCSCPRPSSQQSGKQTAPLKPQSRHTPPAKSLLAAVLPPLVSLAVAGQLHAAEAGLPQALGAAAGASGYVPSPYQPSWEVWAGAAFGAFPFIIATIEFSKRVLIQRRCEKCRGKGLIQNSRGRYVKCQLCGGMLPWLGWKMFFFSTARPGNGGPLLQPRGQTSILYKVPLPPPAPPAAEAPAAGDGQPAAEQRAIEQTVATATEAAK